MGHGSVPCRPLFFFYPFPKPAAREDVSDMATSKNLPAPSSVTIPMPYEKPSPDYNDWMWGWKEVSRGDLCTKVSLAAMVGMMHHQL